MYSDSSDSDSSDDYNWYLHYFVSIGEAKRTDNILKLERGDVNYCKDGYRLLHLAVNRNDLATVQVLVCHGASLNPEYPADSGPPPISPLWTATVQEYEEVAEVLIRAGADVNERISPFGVSFLHMAAAANDQRRVALLLDHGADINARNAYGKSVLQYALNDGEHEVVKLLLEHGADVNIQDNEGMSILHQASAKGDEEIVRLLLNYGADVTTTDSHGSNALHYATAAACPRGNVAVARMLLGKNVPVDGLNDALLTPLHCALAAEKASMVELLLEFGADVNARSQVSGVFPLLIAVQLSNPCLVTLLLCNGARANERTREGTTALHAACAHDAEEIVQVLLDHGADVCAMSIGGELPLSAFVDKDTGAARLIVKRLASLGPEALCEGHRLLLAQNQGLHDFYVECTREIERMRLEKVVESANCSYFHVFSRNVQQLEPLARNDELARVFEARAHVKHFPIYAEEMSDKFDRARLRVCSIIAIESKLTSIFVGYLPHTVIMQIAGYLN